MPKPETSTLATFPLLGELDDQAREAFTSCVEPFEAAAGDHLTTSGTPADGLFLLTAGQVSVLLHDDEGTHEVAVLGPGSHFGEMSLLHDGPASATVVAVTDVGGFLLPSRRRDILEATSLVERLRDTSRRRSASNRVLDLTPVIVPGHDLDIALRPLWPDDWRLMQDSLTRTSQDSLRRRFFSVPNLTEHTLRRLALVDWIDHFAWAVLEDGGAGPLVAVGRYGRHFEERDSAELALIVTDDLQGHGLGKVLVSALAVAADQHGIKDFTATALADNTAVQGLLTRFGAVFGPGDRGQEVEARWPVADALAQVDPELRSLLAPIAALALAAED